MPTVCWKPRPPNKTNMFSIKTSNISKISVSENCLVESEWFCLRNKICPFLAQGICIYVYYAFYETQLDQLPYSFYQLRVRNSCVKGRVVKCFKAIAGCEGIHFMYSNISLEFFRIHIWFTLVANVTVTLKPDVDR
jgi:hypothetical protein